MTARMGMRTADRAARALAVGVALVLLGGFTTGCDETAMPSASESTLVDLYIEDLRAGTRSEREAAPAELAALGDPAAIPALAEALGDESWDVRLAAAEALVTLHDERATAALLALIADTPGSPPLSEVDLHVARGAFQAAIAALGAIGDPAAAPRLAEIAATDPWNENATAAAEALDAIGAPAVGSIADVLAGVDPEAALELVGLLGTLGDAALEPLIEALDDPRPEVRIAAATALAEFGQPAVEPLRALLDAKSRDLRAAAARSLGTIGDTASTRAIVGLLGDSETSAAATRALADMYRDDAAPLVKYLKSKATVGVYRALIRIGQEDTISALVKALDKFGTKRMGEVYLNAGHPSLEKAAKRWARKHGYEVVTKPGAGEEAWGSQ